MGKDEVVTATIIIKDLSSQRIIEYPYDNQKTVEEYKIQVLQVGSFLVSSIQELSNDNQFNTNSYILSLSDKKQPLDNKKTLNELGIKYQTILERIFLSTIFKYSEEN